MKIAICDDDITFVNKIEGKLQEYAKKHDLIFSVERHYTAESVLANQLECSLLLLDVDLPGVSGIECAKTLREQNWYGCIIFISSYVEYAPRGYEFNAFRYILKSQVDSLFNDALDVYIEEYNRNSGKLKLRLIKEGIENTSEDVNVDLSIIIFIESG